MSDIHYNRISCIVAVFALLMAISTAVQAEEWTSVSPLLATADAAAGKAKANMCISCHTFDKGGVKKIGPNLYNIVNRSIAQSEGFAYSDALKAQSGKKWTFENLDKWIFSPKGFALGTKMPFAGIKDAKDRANVIAWLNTLSDKPAPLPNAK